jgi:succinyl-diaminopimelate desuccinylase
VAKTGDMIKIGRRGSMNFRVAVRGTQGHAAYPKRSINPIPIMADLIGRICAWRLDEGSEHFEPSTLAFTTVDVGNPTVYVTPAEVRAGFNIRFNDLHTPDSLMLRIENIARAVIDKRGGQMQFKRGVSSMAFITHPGDYVEKLSEAVRRVNGTVPEYSTGGGTSDARFIKDYCPVVELGLPGRTMHKADECVAVADIDALTRIYESVLEIYFGGAR